MKKFPRKIFVVIETDTDSDYLVASEDLEIGDDGQKVGVYELVDFGVKRITTTLVKGEK